MVLWKSILRVSFKTQVFSTLIYGVLALSVLFAPWPGKTSFIWLPLTLLLIAGWGRTQYKISKRAGPASLQNHNRILWRKSEWEITKPPYITRLGIRLHLRSLTSGRQKYLWIASDSVPAEAWSSLNQLLLQYPDI
ncbi:protein YgfX [Morganella morganii]|uniref:protein YgfX n=1 Tax=Morganella morganii TaxID=582 RepID=UPI000D1DB300|nr:protein YgfX [Morganella morganii]HAE77337.1 hypothetical protein [Morganella sp. (in: enterobacteria)]QXO41831.1 protein YgfX [Morganella morganii]QXO45439.1 protein YgfX [Morganella morganii]QXO49116.1 protein YgfX [Morganella morganii]QXO52956.1 protein YgfX [Morganella morganii]